MMSDSVFDGLNLINQVFVQDEIVLRSLFRDADACCGSSTITKRERYHQRRAGYWFGYYLRLCH